jgi:hypothetical protein
MPTLYDIDGDFYAIDQILDESFEAVSEEDIRILEAWQNELDADLETKADRTLYVIREYEMMSEARSKESRRLAELADSDARKAKRLRAMLLDFMLRNNVKNIRTTHGTISACANGGKLPVEIAKDASAEDVHHDCGGVFTKLKYDFDKDAIRDALAEMPKGETLPFARLGERGHHLRIK